MTFAATAWGTAGAAAAFRLPGQRTGLDRLTFWRTFGGLILPLALCTLLRRGSTAPAAPPPYEPARARRSAHARNGRGTGRLPGRLSRRRTDGRAAVGTVVMSSPWGGAGSHPPGVRDGGGAARRGRCAGRQRAAGGADRPAPRWRRRGRRPAGIAYALLCAASCAAMTLVTRRAGQGRRQRSVRLGDRRLRGGVRSVCCRSQWWGLWPQAHDLVRSLWLMGYVAAVPTMLGYVQPLGGTNRPTRDEHLGECADRAGVRRGRHCGVLPR